MQYTHAVQAFTLGRIGEIDAATIKVLEENAPFNIDGAMQAEIRERLRHCAITLKSEQITPNVSALIKLLDTLESRTRDQRDALQAIASEHTSASKVISLELEIYHGLDVFEILNGNSIILESIKSYRTKILKDTSGGFLLSAPERTDRRGRNQSEAEEIFVRQFIAFYKKYGGDPTAHRKGGLGGNDRNTPFVRFMKQINKLMPEEVRLAEGALITRIDRAKYPRKKAPKAAAVGKKN